MLPEEHKTAIITDGMQFMRTITEAYGADVGMQLWETIADTLDPEVKGQIFFAMITGEYNSKLHICFKPPSAGQPQNAVQAIKAIRTVTGYGLKEAKDMWDDMKNNGARFTLTVDPDKLKSARTELINGGLTVA
jgi:ABC-type Fe3+ transport system substrate-binding protein